MKKNKLTFKISVFLIIQVLFFYSLFGQTLTETFDNHNFTTLGDGSFIGVDNTLWEYTTIQDGGATWPARIGVGGSLSALFTEKISNVSINALGWSSTIPSVFQIYINNELKGELEFYSTGETQSISLSSGCDTSYLTIRLVSGWYYGALSEVEVTFDPLLTENQICSSPYIKYVHTTFGSDPKTEMTVSWASPASDNSSFVHYGTSTSYGTVSSNLSEREVLVDASDDTIVMHHVRLTGLTPGTQYHYRCGGDAGLSGDCTFRTAPSGVAPFTYAVIADVQSRIFSGSFNNCASYLKEQDVDFVIQLADFVQQGCHLKEWKNMFESGKPIFEYAPLMGCLGTNHDVGYESSCGDVPEFVHSLFKFPSNNSSEHQNLWYSFEYSNSLYTSWRTSEDSLLSFMERALSNTSSTWKFAYWHTNPYSTAGHGGDDLSGLLPTYLSMVEDYNVATVFNGHSHCYEITHPILEVGNPPVLGNVTVDWGSRKAVSDLSQGTIFYNGAGIGGSAQAGTYYAHGLPVDFTLTGDSIGGDKTVLLADVYTDSVVYKVVYYEDCKTFSRGDVLFTYKMVNDNPGVQYTLTTSSAGNGSVSPLGANVYNENSVAIVTANPDPAYAFSHWTGDVPMGEENSNPLSITMTSDASITANFVALPTYTLTVNSGTGSGTYYVGQQLSISADAPPGGQEFDAWTGDVSALANANSSTTTVTMPAGDVTVTATYAPLPTYTLTVNDGTGSGDYIEGSEVSISPNAAPAGQEFDAWTGDISYLDNANIAAATVTMPAQAVSLTATYRDTATATYTLTVSGGTGSGEYSEGAVVPVVANNAPTGQEFDAWTGDVTNVVNVNSSSTTITMPASDVNLTATFVDTTPATYSITFGVDDGNSNSLEGVSVTFNGESLLSDANGEVTFTGVSTGAIPYTMNLTGYQERQGVITVNQSDMSIYISLSRITDVTQNSSAFAIYPNPFNSYVTLVANCNISQVRIYSFSGQLLKMYDVEGNQQLDLNLEHLPDGTYIFEIQDSSLFTIQRKMLVKSSR